MNQRIQRHHPNQVGILSRACARIPTTTSEEQLRHLLLECVAGLYDGVRQCEIFACVDGVLVPAAGRSEARARRGAKLVEGLNGPGAQIVAASHDGRQGSLMSAPLVEHGRLLGLIVVEAQAGAANFKPLDGTLLEGLASLFSPALERLRARDRDSGLLRREAQRRFLPPSLPADAGVRIHAEYLPAAGLGGDFYDVVQVGAGQVTAVIGDVSGEGMAAAPLMARVRADFRRLAVGESSPARLLLRIDRGLIPVAGERFVTALCLMIDAPRRILTVANAGHVSPMVRRESGVVMAFGRAIGPPLGTLSGGYSVETLALEPKDIVILMTEGLVKPLDRASDPSGQKMLTSLLEYIPHDPEILCRRVLAAFDKMRSGDLADDATLVALQLVG